MIAWIFLSCFSPKKVKALRVQGAAEGLTLCPGERTPIVVRARQTNGRLRTTDGRRRDRLRWDDVVVRMNERNFEDGGPGGEAAAYVNAMEHNGSTLLQVRVTGTRNGQPLNQYYLLDPDGGSLTVDVSGGPGGVGGSGNDGEDGDDGDLNDNGEQGWGEDGENGGDGGDGGYGGAGGQGSCDCRVISTN